MDIAQPLSLIVSTSRDLLEILSVVKRVLGKDDEKLIAATQQVLELQQLALNVQHMVMSLQEENARLKDRVRELENFDQEKQLHELKQIAPGAWAYVRIGVDEAVQQGPWYCQSCLDDNKKSVLQLAGHQYKTDIYQCPRCDAKLRIPRQEEAHAHVPTPTSEWDAFV